MDPNPMSDVLIRRGDFGHRHGGRAPCDDGGKDCSSESVLQALLATTGSQAEARGLLPAAFRDSRALPTPWCLTSVLRNCEKLISLVLNHQFVKLCHGIPRKVLHQAIAGLLVSPLLMLYCRTSQVFKMLSMTVHNGV